jgi:O-antigen ligase
VKKPIYDSWESLAQEMTANLTSLEGVKLGPGTFQSANEDWCWMNTENLLINNAIQGLVLSLVFASAVLLLATRNLYLTLYSVLTMACIISSVISVM